MCMFSFIFYRLIVQKKNVLIAVCLSLAAVLFGWQSAWGQEGIDLIIDNVSDENFPAISFELTPTNRAGVPLVLTEENISISDEAGELPIVSLDMRSDPAEPVSIMIAIDASGSMQQSGELEEVRQQIIAFRETLNPFDEVGVLFFSLDEDGTGVAVYPAADPREFTPSLDGGGSINFMNRFTPTDPNAGTPLYDAIYRSMEVLAAEADYGRRAVIVLTDGTDVGREDGATVGSGSTRADLDIVVDRAQELSIPIFTVGLRGDNEVSDSQYSESVGAISLTKLADESGGNEQFFVSASNVSNVLADTVDLLKTKFSVTTQALIEPDNRLHPLTIGVQMFAGEATITQDVLAYYPIKPDIQLNYLDNEQTSMSGDTLADGVSGTLLLQPAVLSRNAVVKVDYFIDDKLVHSSNVPPFAYEVDTAVWLDNAVTMAKLKVVATDNQNPANVNEIEQTMWIQPCALTCFAAENNFTTLDTTMFMAILSALAVLVILLVFFVFFTVLRNRRQRQPQPELFTNQTFQPVPVHIETGAAPYVPPTPPAGDTNVMNDTIADHPLTIADAEILDNGATLTDIEPALTDGGSTIVDLEPIIPKTEVLDRPSSSLAYLFSQETGQQHPLDGVKITIGRTDENQICLPDTAVSSQHAVIQSHNNQYTLFDAGAVNPILVNDQPLEDGKLLQNGDRIQLGRQIWVFKEISG